MTTVSGAESRSAIDKPARFVPGQPDMWFFALFEALVFTSYFVVYMYTRTQHTQLFLLSQAKLDLRIGALNTLLLLASSWSMARCVQASRTGAARSALRSALLTTVFGALFLVSKTLEWARLIHRGLTFTTNAFFTHYFFLTMIHALHLLIGFVVLGILVYQLRSPARRSQKLIETCATYWHTVDLLWVLIFSLLYVVR
ncbi:MAG TPA: cytochrome c oxidase subunit 3 [Rugosimonospora sp.]|nr:cytochrome c oxidase subunit 3 [Rugosimonospora sp.]